MITEAIIQSIDNTSNTCKVRVPLFETSKASKKITLTANFAIIPGIYNSYVVGDKVFIAFENNIVDRPIILGKIYTGADAEGLCSAGVISCTNLVSNSTVALPINGTTFVFPNKDTTDNTLLEQITLATGYTDLLTLINTVANLKTRVEQLETTVASLTSLLTQNNNQD